MVRSNDVPVIRASTVSRYGVMKKEKFGWMLNSGFKRACACAQSRYLLLSIQWLLLADSEGPDQIYLFCPLMPWGTFSPFAKLTSDMPCEIWIYPSSHRIPRVPLKVIVYSASLPERLKLLNRQTKTMRYFHIFPPLQRRHFNVFAAIWLRCIDVVSALNISRGMDSLSGAATLSKLCLGANSFLFE